MDDPSRLLCKHSVAPHKLGYACAVPGKPAMLLYMDTTERMLHWLDLSDSKPKSSHFSPITLQLSSD